MNNKHAETDNGLFDLHYLTGLNIYRNNDHNSNGQFIYANKIVRKLLVMKNSSRTKIRAIIAMKKYNLSNSSS